MSAHQRAGRGGPRPRVAIVGAGFGGIGLAIALKRAGHHDFVIVERAADIGGVWRDNTYPGAACDIPSHLYCYSFEPRRDWGRRYASQAEILRYLHDCADKYGLRSHLRVNTEVESAEFDEGSALWRLRTGAGETIEAEVLVPACGQLSNPRIPRIPGADRFTGHTVHSARWSHDHDLTGRWVAVIGTGSSALQIVPEIAPLTGHLTVFQRSAPYVVPKWDRVYRPPSRWSRRLPPLPQKLARLGWWLFNEALVSGLTRRWPTARLTERGSQMQLRTQLDDPELREKLTPRSELGCKRVGISSTYYPALNRPDVSLVTEPITEITDSAVRTADGVRHPVDTIIYATGFAATEFLASLRVRGRGGRELSEVWRDGARAYLGMAVPGFPNMFMIYGPNTNIGAGSAIYMIESQIRYITAAVRELTRGRTRFLEVRAEVAEAFDQDVQRRLRRSVWSTCTSWYRHSSGRVTNNWPGQTADYRRRTARLNRADYRPVPPRTAPGARP
ncbi:flavin-containing monooxygenase [Streptomyces sp. NRRL S-920]|uniref:flavin-containing monooxygenase n=1 Tax=Streptomyces sp. NRRL S-920 TaxID=1463921 RepID=UPI000689F120|nr:NAD(P)/FAD-dependent oxidoreductase [Streptomyces sp. NRRL S-920]